MDAKRHEEIMIALNDKETSLEERTAMLQELREDNAKMIGDFETFTNKQKELEEENKELLLTNSKLFRSQRYYDDTFEKQEEEQKKKSFSETATIEDLERGAQ